MGVIGYKGGHVEKDFLQRLGIPSVNLEEFGCPKFEHLTAPDFNPVEGCGFHVRQSHCAMVKCEHARKRKRRDVIMSRFPFKATPFL